MATWIWAGGLGAVAQVWEAEIDGYDGATTYGITINGKTVSLAGVTDAATTIAALIVLLNDSAEPEFAEITWAEGSTNTHVKGTMDRTGVPFTATTYTSGGAGTMDPTTGNTMTVVTAGQGPNQAEAANFKTDAGVRGVSGGTEPANGDTIIFRKSDIDCLYNLDYMTSLTIAAFQEKASYTGVIGLPQTNEDAVAYNEYRPRAFMLSSGTLAMEFGEGVGSGSPKTRVEIAGGDTVTSVLVYGTGSSEDDLPALEVVGDANTFSAVTVKGGSVWFNDAKGGGTDTLTAITVESGEVIVEGGATLTAVNLQGDGILRNNGGNAIGTLDTREAGTLVHPFGDITTWNAYGGILVVPAITTLTITTANMGAKAVLDVSGAVAIVTATTINPEPGCTVSALNGMLTVTNAIDLGYSSWDDFNFDFGPGKDFTIV